MAEEEDRGGRGSELKCGTKRRRSAAAAPPAEEEEICILCILNQNFYGTISFWETLERLKVGWIRKIHGETTKYVGKAEDGSDLVLTVWPDGTWIKESDAGWTETGPHGQETSGTHDPPVYIKYDDAAYLKEFASDSSDSESE